MKNITTESSFEQGENMDIIREYQNPSRLLVAFMDSINEPVCIVDNSGNCILNQTAKKFQNDGLDMQNHVKKLKDNSSVLITHQGKKYNLHKKDINHGTNSFVCTLKQEDEIITRLTASSNKLRKILNEI